MQLYRHVNYTAIWNGLDYPAAVFPVTTVDPVVDVKKPPHKFMTETDKQVYELCPSTA
jgi:amidase